MNIDRADLLAALHREIALARLHVRGGAQERRGRVGAVLLAVRPAPVGHTSVESFIAAHGVTQIGRAHV